MRSKKLSFISIVSLFATSNALQLVGRGEQGTKTLDLTSDKVFKLVDSDNDGRLSLHELQESAAFTWEGIEAANRARITFGLAHPSDFILAYDVDGDGYLSTEEFAEAMGELETRPQSECKALSDRLDTCKTHQILKCSAYLNTAERMCQLGHRSVVEQCILSSPCGNICSCVFHAESAAHGDAVVVYQFPNGQAETQYGSSLITANSTYALGHQKRMPFIFLALIIAVVVEIALAAMYISASEIYEQTRKEVHFMNFEGWNSDGDDPIPKCSVYVYWSTKCGAIGTGKSRSCSHGGSRLYKNSCKDHFRHGSRGCDFLGLGCRSVCYNVNEEGCPCSIFDKWNTHANTDFPGNDIEKLHVEKLSDCRAACASSDKCLGFVVPRFDGSEEQTNCYLKGELGPRKKSTDTTSFIKILSNAKTCPTSFTGSDGQFGVFDRREVSEPTHALVPRIDDKGINGKAFPFDANDITFVVIARFLQALYQTMWINREQVQRTSFESTLAAIGARELTALNNEPVANRANPRWRVSDGWRPINVFRNLLHNGNSGDTPVADYLNQQPTGTELEQAAMPARLRQILIANEQAINRGTLPWAGSDSRTTGYPGVQSLHAGGSNLGYYQGGAMGPFPMEGAFIMATQLAGINFRTMAQRNLRRPAYWLNAIVPRNGAGDSGVPQCLRQYKEEHEFDPTMSRILGFMSRDGDATGGPREGFYVIIDVDGGNDVQENPDRNVFVFVVHTIDPHSRINVPNANNLRNLQYTQFDPNANPDAAPRGPGAGEETNSPAQQRYFAHAHAGYFPWSRIREFMNQNPSSSERVTFPGYVQVGSFHIYISSEDEHSVHPRRGYLDNDNGGRKHDEL